MSLFNLFHELIQRSMADDATVPDAHIRHRSWRVRLAAAAGEALGRLLLGGTFAGVATVHLAGWNEAVRQIAARGVPVPAPSLSIATVVEALAGLGIMCGLETRLAALVLAVVTAGRAVLLDGIWPGGAGAQVQPEVFAANLALTGALLVVAARGPGPWSLDVAHRRSRHRC